MDVVVGRSRHLSSKTSPMKKSLLTLGLLSVAAIPLAHATSVTWSGVPSARTAVDHLFTQVTAGSLVWAGTFANDTVYTFNPALSIATNVANFTSSDGWKQFTLDPATGLPDLPLAITNTLAVSASGKLSGTVTDNNGTPGLGLQASFFDNKGAYLWVFNATTVASATEMGIFRAITTSPWSFPPNNNGSGDVVSLSSSNAAAPTIAVIGGAGSTNTTQFILAASTVPEPSVLALGGLAGIGMLSSRRRKQRK